METEEPSNESVPIMNKEIPSALSDVSIEKILSAFCCMHSAYLFLFDEETRNIIYTSNYTVLRAPFDKDFTGYHISQLLSHFSGTTVDMGNLIIDAICSFSQKKSSSDWFYIVDLDIRNSYDKVSCPFVYKFFPIRRNEITKKSLFLCTINLSAYQNYDAVCAINISTKEKFIYSLERKRWKTIKYKPLTDTELTIIWLSARGSTVDEIAAIIHRSVDAVKSAKKRIYQKIYVKNMVQAAISLVNNRTF